MGLTLKILNTVTTEQVSLVMIIQIKDDASPAVLGVEKFSIPWSTLVPPPSFVVLTDAAILQILKDNYANWEIRRIGPPEDTRDFTTLRQQEVNIP